MHLNSPKLKSRGCGIVMACDALVCWASVFCGWVMGWLGVGLERARRTSVLPVPL